MINEIVLYQSNELAEHIEVRIDDETVWLTLNQISQLFNRDKSVISRHLRNVFKDGELVFEASVAKNATVQIEAGREVKREIEYYNLDAILSVGYRVNSKQGTQFRIWANSILRDYLLKGYAVNQRINKIENQVDNLAEEVNRISLQIQSGRIPNQGVFFDGQVFDAYELASKIIRSARNSIVLIDNYINESTLTHLAKKNMQVKVHLLSKAINKQLILDVQKANEQYGNFEIHEFSRSHDRFIIIDESEVYHLGASLKDLGKKWFAFSKLDKSTVENILTAITNHIRTKK
jgi:hypothetical protein